MIPSNKDAPPLLVAADLDGTLAFKGTVPRETINVLEQLRSGPTRFTIATGRAVGSLQDLVSLCTTDVVSEGGARRTDPRTRATVEVHPLDEVSLDWLEAMLEEGHITCASYAPAGTIPYTAFLAPGATGSSLFAKDGVEFITANEFLMRVKAKPPARINFRWGTERVTIPFGLNVALNEGSCDLLPHGIDKASAVRALAADLGIPLDRVVVIGNDLNDLSMLQMPDVHAIVVGDLLSHIHLPRVRGRVPTPHDLATVLCGLMI